MKASIDELLQDAQRRRASDLHLTVGISPRCRVNGELVDMGYDILSSSDLADIAMPMVPDRLTETLQNEGEVDFSYSIKNVGRYRVNLFRQRGSYALAIRIIDTLIPTPEELGIPASIIELSKKKRGLILVSGPAGSGKSTTLATIIDLINNNQNRHIITLEDPIEYLHKHNMSIVNQREIGTDSRSFSNALMEVLREDPDVILIGEMKDYETMEIAIRAAETGRLVLTSINTVGAINTLERMVDVFPPHRHQQVRVQLSSVLEGVISQQLIPTADQSGRVAAYEIILSNPSIRSLLREGKLAQITTYLQTNKRQGMKTMDEAIYELYLFGKITKEQAIFYSQDIQAMERKLNYFVKDDEM